MPVTFILLLFTKETGDHFIFCLDVFMERDKNNISHNVLKINETLV